LGNKKALKNFVKVIKSYYLLVLMKMKKYISFVMMDLFTDTKKEILFRLLKLADNLMESL